MKEGARLAYRLEDPGPAELTVGSGHRSRLGLRRIQRRAAGRQLRRRCDQCLRQEHRRPSRRASVLSGTTDQDRWPLGACLWSGWGEQRTKDHALFHRRSERREPRPLREARSSAVARRPSRQRTVFRGAGGQSRRLPRVGCCCSWCGQHTAGRTLAHRPGFPRVSLAPGGERVNDCRRG